MEPRRAHDFGSRDQSPMNDHVFVTPPGFVPGFRGRALIFCKEGRPSSTNRGTPVYCDRGRYYEAFTDNNQVIIGARRNDIKAYNYPREDPPPGFGPVTIEEGPFSGPRARHERVFGKLRASTSRQSDPPEEQEPDPLASSTDDTPPSPKESSPSTTEEPVVTEFLI